MIWKHFFNGVGEKKQHKDINGVEIFFPPEWLPRSANLLKDKGPLKDLIWWGTSVGRRSNAPGPHYKAE